MRWDNQPSYGPWDAVGQIASAIMQRNQQRGQDKKDLQSTQSLFSLLQPSDVDTGTGMRSQLNLDPSLQSVRGEQPKRLFDFGKIGQTPPIYGGQGLFSVGNPSDMVEQGNIDLSMRPTVKNADGSISTVRSMGANIDGKEVLLPTVSNDGRIMTDDEAVNNYRQTGQHLGVFSSPESSTQYANSLHNQQAGMYGGGPSLQQPAIINGQNVMQQPQRQIQDPTYTQKNRTIKDVENDIRKNYATRMQEAIKSGNINPTMLRQYMPQIQQQMNSEIEQARGDYKKSQGDAALQDVLSANGSSAQKKAFIKYAQATGNMDTATLKGLLSSNTQKYDDGANIHFYRTDNFGNPIDTGENGSPQPYFSIPKQVSVETRASQEFQEKERQKDRDAAAANAAMRVSSSGGSGNGLSTANLFSLYKDATETVQEATGEFDSSGRPVMTRRIKNPELAQRLKPIIDSMLPGGGGQSQDNYQPQPAQQDLSGKVSAARAKGISDSQIRSALASDGLSQAEINSLLGTQPQPQRQQPELNPVGLDASMWY